MSEPVRGGAPATRNSNKSLTTKVVVARVQSAVAKQNGGGVPKGSYVGRMQ